MIAKNLTSKNEALTPIVRFFLADDFRAEVSGKVTAVGLYTDYVVVMLMPSDAAEPSETDPVALNSLGFLFNISNVTKPVTIALKQDISGKKSLMIPQKEYDPGGIGKTINLTFSMNPCAITSFGTKTFVITVDKKEYDFNIEFRRQTIPSSAIESPKKTKQKRKPAHLPKIKAAVES